MATGQGLMQTIGFTEEKIVSRFRIQAVRETVRAFEQAVHQIHRGGGQIIPRAAAAGVHEVLALIIALCIYAVGDCGNANTVAHGQEIIGGVQQLAEGIPAHAATVGITGEGAVIPVDGKAGVDRKSTRLNSSHP